MGIYESRVRVLSLEISFIHALSEHFGLVKYVIAVKVLVGRLREIVLAEHGILTDLVLDHPVVHVVNIATIDAQVIADQVLLLSISMTERIFLEVQVLRLCIAMTENLRLSAEILF